ncbi:hypothetical protein FIV00_08025 [Labrenzia sp. THAF82]|uniref:hypothetical protein n=1 Tax=Labrenzia sp. THAF82 TaxID=2587861 RepID=UPI001267AD54|nr:hypothetical protein [Labrenzia sp. THAF82]QFT30417.1 hypothetical protein FIV00_08025 [Labrenzia sp. THAF82]
MFLSCKIGKIILLPHNKPPFTSILTVILLAININITFARSSNEIHTLEDVVKNHSAELLGMIGGQDTNGIDEIYPPLENSENLFVVSEILYAAEVKFPGICRFKSQKERKEFLNAVAMGLFSPEMLNELMEETCFSKVFYLKNEQNLLFIQWDNGDTWVPNPANGEFLFVKITNATDFADFVKQANSYALKVSAGD